MCGSPGKIAEGIATGGISTVADAIIPKAPSAPTLPQYPGMSPQEIAILQQQQGGVNQMGGVVSGVAGQLGNNQQILQMISGLFKSDGTIDQNAVAQLQQQIQQSNQTSATQGQNTLSGISGTNDALGATQQAYTSALQGNAPANKAIEYQQLQNFNAMKEQAAQHGIQIDGDNWATATSSSTAGQKLLQNAQQNNNIQNQQYQLGYLGQLGTNMGQLAGVGQTQATTGMGLSQYSQTTPTGYVGQSITGGQGALSPMLSQYNQMASSLYQPYYMQQQGPYQQQMAQQQANYQAGLNQYQGQMNMLGGIMNLGGKIGGAAMGAPASA